MAKPKAAKKGPRSSKHRRILYVLATLRRRGKTDAPRKKVAFLAELKLNSTFGKYLTTLKDEGCIEYGPQTSLRITDKGLEEVDDELVDDLPEETNEAAHSQIKEKQLKGKEVQIFEHIVDGGVYDKKDLAQAIGVPFNSTFGKWLTSMYKKDIVEYPSKGTVTLSTETCFPCGRPA